MPAYDSLLTLKTLGVQTGSTNGTPVDLGSSVPNGGQLMQFDLMFNSFGGTTPTADIIIEESPDQSNWRQVTQFRQITGANDGTFAGANQNGKKMCRFGLVTQRYMRYRSAMAGTGANVGFGLYARGMDAVAREVPLMTF